MGCDQPRVYVIIPPWISTHTSRVGCDQWKGKWVYFLLHFYSHIPCGMWPLCPLLRNSTMNFYSHIPCGMWQKIKRKRMIIHHFYSHIPCGMWQETAPKRAYRQNFYSHIPCGMWQLSTFKIITLNNFYSHIPCGMWPRFFRLVNLRFYISTHTSRVGCDFVGNNDYSEVIHFYSHIPCGMWHHNR